MIYFTDGTKESFLTAFLAAYSDEEAYITSSQAQLALGQKSVFVGADSARAARAEQRLLSFDKDCIEELTMLLRSGEPEREQLAFGYLKFLSEERRPVRGMLAKSEVLAAQECLARVTREIHRLHGFVRFLECESGALYAPIVPKADICDLLVPHFQKRLQGIPFVLHDVPRKKAAVCDGKRCFAAPLEQAQIVLSASETQWQQLWRKYYQSVNLPSREKLKQMRGNMPVRYWRVLTELH